MWLHDHNMYVPCGRCRACRVSKSREMTVRMIHESDYHNDSLFLTLTYNDESLPENKELSKNELQKFFKRLRKSLGDRKIKYYASGEYGDLNRPHYHAIIFGLSTTEHGTYRMKRVLAVESGPVFDAWAPRGFITIGPLTFQTARYVTQYIHKKKWTNNPDKIQQPFCLSSNGIGKDYVLNNQEELFEKVGLTLNGIQMGLPKYYNKKLKEIDEERIKKGLREKAKERENELVDHYLEKYGDFQTISPTEALEASRIQSELNLEVSEKLRSKKL